MKDQRRVITQGEHAVSNDPAVVVSTLLGSCVAVCLWDPTARVGGMNHMLLTRQGGTGAQRDLIGINAMELLINDILKLGGNRTRLAAKIFGGAQMVDGLSDIGTANCAFTIGFLRRERILVVGQSLGGSAARQLLYWPESGIARQKVANQQMQIAAGCAGPSGNRGNGVQLF